MIVEDKGVFLFFYCLAANGKLSDVADFVKRNYKITSGKNQIKNNFLPLRKVFATTYFDCELK